MTTRTYKVECSRWDSPLLVTIFTCSQNDDATWYAYAPGFGCSRNYVSSVEAVQALLAAECCTNIEIMKA